MLNFEDELRQKFIPTAKQAARQSVQQMQRDVFESHRHHIFSVAFYMTGNELEAEEILTHTFVNAFERDEKPDRSGIDEALIDELRQRFPLLHAAKATEAPAIPNGGKAIGRRQVLRPDLEAAIQDLPPLERILFLLRDVEGYSAEVAGDLLGLSQPEAKSTALSARLHLRQLLANGSPAQRGRSSESSEAA